MSREILFRGRSLKTGNWIEGFYCKMDETTYCTIEDYKRNPVPTHHYIVYESMTDWGLPNEFRFIEVDPSTVCQYTGLTDRDGVKIFENDIVTFAGYSKDNRGWIRFGSYSDARGTADTNYGWFIDFIENNDYYRQDFGFWVNKITVIGNYFDTPELLEGGTGEDD